MAERQSKLFPNKKARPRTNGMKDMEEFTKSLSIIHSFSPLSYKNLANFSEKNIAHSSSGIDDIQLHYSSNYSASFFR